VPGRAQHRHENGPDVTSIARHENSHRYPQCQDPSQIGPGNKPAICKIRDDLLLILPGAAFIASLPGGNQKKMLVVSRSPAGDLM